MGDALEIVGTLTKAIIPPHDANSEKVFWWRLTLAGTVIAMAGMTTLHVALACGFLPAFFPGFANAADVRQMANEAREGRIESLDSDIYQKTKDWCVQLSNGNLGAAQALDLLIREKKMAYFKLSGQQYPQPPCELFVLGTAPAPIFPGR